MVNYKNGKIYKITANEGRLIYIGSTVSKLSIRFTAHKSKAKLRGSTDYKISNITSYELFQYDDVDISLIEAYPCTSRKELEHRERYYMDCYDCVNKVKPLYDHESTNERIRIKYKNNTNKYKDRKKEYWLKNREKYREYTKKYYLKNKAIIIERSRKSNQDKIDKQK